MPTICEITAQLKERKIKGYSGKTKSQKKKLKKHLKKNLRKNHLNYLQIKRLKLLIDTPISHLYS